MRTLLYVILLLNVITSAAFADGETQIEQLEEQKERIVDVENYVESADLGRLIVLKKLTQRVIDSLKEKGLGHMATINSYQEMAMAFRYSEVFFKQISTTVTDDSLQKLIKTNNTIIKERGFDEVLGTSLVAHIVTQMQVISAQLAKLPVSEKLKSNVASMQSLFGQAISVAKQGDRPRAFAKGTEIYNQLLNLYPEMEKVSASNQAYMLVVELMGLNEFFASYAQIKD